MANGGNDLRVSLQFSKQRCQDVAQEDQSEVQHCEALKRLPEQPGTQQNSQIREEKTNNNNNNKIHLIKCKNPSSY